MKRLHCFNLFGVLALASLCVWQWQRDRVLNLEVNRLEKIRMEAAARLAEQEQQARGLATDLAGFKQRYAQSQASAVETMQKLRTVERDVHQLSAERDQLTASVSNWVSAVASRDERLKEANARIRQLTDEINITVRKFNDLATNHNAVVKDLNELRAR